MKRLLYSVISLGLMSGLILAACSQDEAVENLQKQKAAAIEENETRAGGSVVRCNITTTEKGQVNTLIDEWAAKNDIPRVGITHLTISGPINKADIQATVNFQNLDSLVLQDAKLDTLPAYSFENFKSKAAVILPNTLKRIEDYGCYRNNAISFYVPDNATDINNYTFYNCPYLQEVHLPKNLTLLTFYMFYDCKSLAKIEIPQYVTKIDKYVFENCTSLTSVELPDYVVEMGYEVFDGCSGLETVKWPTAMTTIPAHTFRNCAKLKFTIPDYITSIGEGAFDGCKAITEFKLPASMKTVGTYCFAGSGITSVTLTADTPVNNYMFSETPVTSITLQEGMTTLSEGVFSNCKKLESIQFPSSMKSIGVVSFGACSNLKSVSLNEGLTTIGNGAFRETGLTSVTLPSSVTSLGNYAFDDCPNLTSFTFNEGLETIGQYAFRKAPITSLSLSSTVKTIDDYAFYECKELSSIAFNEGLTTIGSYAFYDDDALASISLPSTVTSIGMYAFGECSQLSSIILNEGLQTIGYEAFEDTPIETLTIPSTVTKCGDNIVVDCGQLTSIFWNSSTEAPQLYYSSSNRNILLYLKSGNTSTKNANTIMNGTTNEGIVLTSSGNFRCPQAFKTNIRYEKKFSDPSGIGEAAGWKTIVLPFDVTSITCNGDVLAPFGSDVAGAKNFWLRELTADGFVRATKIEANKPYIIAMPNNEAYDPQYNISGTVIFSAENVTIPVTEELQPSVGKTFDLCGTYKILGKSAERLVLNTSSYRNNYDKITYKKGGIFIASTNTCYTFEAYAKSKTGTRAIPLSDYVTTRTAKTLGPVPMEDDM